MKLTRRNITAAAMLLGLLLNCGIGWSQIVLTNLTLTGALSQFDTPTSSIPVNYSSGNTAQSLTNTSSSTFSNIVTTATSELNYVLVSPNAITISGHLSMSASLPAFPNSPPIRSGYAVAGSSYGLAFVSLPGTIYSLKFAATFPPKETPVITSLTNTYVQTTPNIQYLANADGVYRVSTNDAGLGGAFVYTNDNLFVTNYTLLINPSVSLGLSVIQSYTDAATNVTRSADFISTVAVPYLNPTRNGSQFTLTWPTNLSTYILERSTNLTGLGGWTTVSSGITVSNGLNVLTLPIGAGGNGFYRLKR